ncbi:hypothetical protein PpBr36_01208 [Pyricularia pennisetigena]|uniref:hypothetical protein n=1 Tax=Pyricularia pennisetigena TaxID=1578925 RepID=UPI001151BD57|nr:hypothetical protein PpBr36_01208 [Pyricularia pennisetigena]TLS27736.1 hypothetical protein PpBr36_01208 [Pyricularia pennisetigena]
MSVSLLFSLSILAASVTPVLSSCAYGTHLMPRAEGGEVKVGKFGYAGSIAPANWVALDPTANALCNTGTNQSPISMTAGNFQVVQAADVQLEIPDFPATEFENLGTTVEVIAKGGKMTVAGVSYDLQQFHFHLPSEHLDNGTSMAMEMHMVWQSAAKEIAVIGMYIDIEGNPAAAAPAAAQPARRHARHLEAREDADPSAPLPGMQKMGETARVAAAAVKSNLLATLMPEVSKIATPGTKTETPPLVMSELVQQIKSGSFQSYSGSLTTPPCSEGVRWLVSTQKLAISAENFFSMRNVIGFNARFAQNNPGQPNLMSLATASTGGAKNSTGGAKNKQKQQLTEAEKAAKKAQKAAKKAGKGNNATAPAAPAAAVAGALLGSTSL